MKFIDTNKNICCDDVIQCIFDLSKQDTTIYKKLKQTGEIRADDLAKKLKKDRSTIYRSLQKLTCSGLITKNTKTIASGGYYHTYQCNDIKEVKEKLEQCINNWHTKMKDTIKELE